MKLIKLYAVLVLMFLCVSAFAGVYTVKKGDTLSSIAEKYNTTACELAAVNNLNINSTLNIGQKITIVKLDDGKKPASKSETYKVKKGDTLSSIASKYGMSVGELAKLNGINQNAVIKIGQELKIRGSEKVSQKTNSDRGASLVSIAMGLKGTKYVSGGTSRGGFDCSGLTCYVYAQKGITIPRTAAMQYRGGTAVDKKNLQKGDIVCFATRGNGCSHVGIYIGGGKFIHAATTEKGVIVSDLNSSYYKSKFLGGRRY